MAAAKKRTARGARDAIQKPKARGVRDAIQKPKVRGVRDAIQKPKAKTTAPPKGYEVTRLNRGSTKGVIAIGGRSGNMPYGYAMRQGKGVASRAASVATAKAMQALNLQDRKAGQRRSGPLKRTS